MKITIISGSHRRQAQSLKVAEFIRGQLREKGVEASVLSLSGNPLPLWDEGVWEDDPAWHQRLAPWREQLAASDGFVVISPEWHGQVPAGLKNFFLLFGWAELGHKPALIVAVSSGDGGAYPVAELRMSSYKNNRLCYIPEQVIVRHVEEVLNASAQDNDARSDKFYRQRISWALDILRQYAVALKGVRESGVVESDQFCNGM